MKFNYLLMIIIIFILVLGCKKESDEVKKYPFYEVSTRLYPFLFDLGSYWIYEKTGTNKFDSLIVIGVEKDQFSLPPSGPGQGPQGDMEFYNISYLIFPEQKTYTEQLFSGYISRGLIQGGFTLLANGKIGEKFVNAEVSDSLGLLKVGNIIYHNVLKMRVNKDNFLESDFYLYYKDSIGVIKKEIIENNIVTGTWDLLRYKVKMIKI